MVTFRKTEKHVIKCIISKRIEAGVICSIFPTFLVLLLSKCVKSPSDKPDGLFSKAVMKDGVLEWLDTYEENR